MNTDTKYLIAYLWIISVLGAVFVGHEIALMSSDKELRQMRSVANDRLAKCHQVITGVK